MLLDLIFAALIVFAVVKGYQRGFIVGLFSLLAVIVGLAAAMKLSVVMAHYLGKAVNISDQWLPALARRPRLSKIVITPSALLDGGVKCMSRYTRVSA